MTDLSWLSGDSATSAFTSLLDTQLDSHKIFEVREGKYHLVNRDGEVLPYPIWDAKPEVKSFLFFEGEVAGESRLYTLLGDEVIGFRGKRLVTLLHFWVVYAEGGKMFIARLEQEGLNFKVGKPLEIQAYGCLGHEEVIVKQTGAWRKFAYATELVYIQDVPWLANMVPAQIQPLMEKGFSYEFIRSNCEHLRIQCPILPQHQLAAFRTANIKEKKVFQQLSQLAGLYSTEDITNALGLSPTIMYVLEYYRKLKNVEDL